MSQLSAPQRLDPFFSQPFRQMFLIVVALTLVGAGVYFGFEQISSIFHANVYLNGVIFAVFALGIFSCLAQVAQLMTSVGWIKGFSNTHGKFTQIPPSLLAPLATLLGSKGQSIQLSSTSARSILESVAQRVDEDREITRYIGNTLIFLGLLGTFYGLATTVPALVETIKSLNPEQGEDGASIFSRLQAGLEHQLGGMGTAFSSSLLGLAGSLVVGLLELFVSHGQSRFYRELEEWLSTMTRLVGAGSDESIGGDMGLLVSFIDHMAEQNQSLQDMLTASELQRQRAAEHMDERICTLISTLEHRQTSQLQHTNSAQTSLQSHQAIELLSQIADHQDQLVQKISQTGLEGIDAESRMRLRSIDVQMLRVIEELATGRQELIGDLRREFSALSRAVKTGRDRPSLSAADLGDK